MAIITNKQGSDDPGSDIITGLPNESDFPTETLFRVMDSIDDGVWDWNLQSGTIVTSPAWSRMLGYEATESRHRPDEHHRFLHPDEQGQVLDRLHEFMQTTEDRLDLEYRLQHSDGHYLYIMCRILALRDSVDGKVKRLIGINADETQRKQSEQALQESEQRFRCMYDDSPTMFFTLGIDGTIRSVNHFGAEQLGYSINGMTGGNILDFLHEEDQEVLLNHINKCKEKRGRIHRCEFRACHRFGDVFWLRVAMRMISADSGKDILVSCEDITETRILSEQLDYQAKHDSLTGLVNRAEFERRLRYILSESSAEDEHALCYLDLDQFKIINDTCGHLAGDELLRRVSQHLDSQVRKGDTLARLGGDEFAVLLEYCPIPQAQRVATNILYSMQELRFSWEKMFFNPGVTIGVVPISGESGTVSDVLSAADAACYAAKDAGRNRVHVYHPDDMQLSQRRGEMQWVSEINQALEENRLCLAMQPIMRLSAEDSPARHFELLVRMRSKSGEIISPGAFLPAAERYNLSVKLDREVVTKAFDWLLNQGREASDRLCAINLSGHSLSDLEFLDFLLQKFQTEGIDAHNICFEITETAAVGNLGDAIHFINTLRSIGCSFSLDDFGTGLSSFNYLKNLPVDYLKIDGSFIRDITTDPIDAAMVRSINEIGHVMGKQTIAEFVESEDILVVLRDIGVDYAQGYAVGRPELLQD